MDFVLRTVIIGGKENKMRLAASLKKDYGVDVSVNSIFDVQVKRIHEYKRQLMNVPHIIAFCNRLKKDPNMDFVRRTVTIGGKE